MGTEWWYRLDRGDRVVDVGPGWDEFALDNNAPGAMRSRVLGQPLIGFVAGARMQSLLRTVLDRARGEGGITELPFRCDAPGTRRFMSWTAEPVEGGELLIRTRLLAEGEREALRFLAPGGVRSGELVRMCGWCNRIDVEGEAWLEADTAAERLGLFTLREVPPISHGICPTCSAGLIGAEGSAAA